MLILLPPSEGKAPPRPGAPLDLAALSLPALRAARERVLRSLVTLCARPNPERARVVLGLSAGQLDEVRRNAGLREAGTVPAGRLYTGVLYDALDLAGLSAPAHRLARRSILVFSGLWGAVRIDDLIPPYRCSVGVRLPRLGPLGGYWRSVLPAAVAPAAGHGPVLDLRSAAYASMWAPDRALAGRTVAVRVVHERVVDGVVRRATVSHFNKATKGRLVRSLLTGGVEPASADELVSALRDLKYRVEERPAPAAAVRRLDVVVAEL